MLEKFSSAYICVNYVSVSFLFIEIICNLQIAKNVKNIIRCYRFFDYNNAGWIQRHALWQILEITCFKMKDPEFEM